MKRLIQVFSFLIIAVACVLLVISGCTHAFAEDSFVTDGQGFTTIIYSQPSDYAIIIPETIDASAGSYIFQAANLNIASNERVFVVVESADTNNRITFTHEDGEYTLAKQIITQNVSGHSIPDGLPQNCVGYFEPDESCSALSFSLSTENYDYQGAPKAGNYTAVVQFSIYLNDGY